MHAVGLTVAGNFWREYIFAYFFERQPVKILLGVIIRVVRDRDSMHVHSCQR